MILGDMFDVSVGGTTFLAIILFIISLIIFILWIVIGWRAMKAHEKIADKLEQITVAQKNTALPAASPPPTPAPQPAPQENFRKLDVEQNKLYRHFLNDVPEAAGSLPKVRHELFREWIIKNGFES